MASDADDGSIHLAEQMDPLLVEAAEAFRAVGPQQLADIRSASEKWIAGITTLYGAFGIVGFAAGRDAIVRLEAGWKIAFAAAIGVAAVLVGWAIYWAYRAAYGWPTVRPVRDDDELRAWYADRAAAPLKSAVRFRAGVRCAGVSLAALVAAAFILWFSPSS